MTEQKKTLVQKLISVYEEIDHIDKRGRNTAQGAGYNYVRATDLAHAIRNALLKLNVYAEVNFENENQYTIARAEGKQPFTANDVRCTILFHDGDSEQVLTSSGIGTGADLGDKAIYKAQTGALKYALRNAFLVPDEADPEADESTDEKPIQTKTYSKPAAPKQEPVINVPKAEIPNSLSGTDTPKTLESNSTPTAEELKQYRDKFANFRKRAEDAGLTGKAPLTAMKKTLNYLLAFAGKDKAEQITHEQWTKFFEYVGNMDDAILVAAINTVNNGGTNE